MKKNILSILVALIAFVQINAQTATLMPLVAGDTVVNTATVNKSFTSTGTYSAVGVQAIVNKVSGTVAGTATFQGSLNNVNWENIGTAFTLTDVATQSKVFTQTGGSPFVYYRVMFTGSGTMSAQVRLYYVQRKFQ